MRKGPVEDRTRPLEPPRPWRNPALACSVTALAPIVLAVGFAVEASLGDGRVAL